MALGALIGKGLISAAGGALGGLFGGSDKEKIDINKLAQYQAPTQGLVDEQLGLSRQMMDPQSAMNMRMRRLLAERSAESGQLIGQQMMKMGAMRNMSPAQMMMQARIGQNSAMGGVNNAWMNSLLDRYNKGLGVMGSMTGVQKGLDENLGNAYLSNINLANQESQSQGDNIFGGLMGGLDMTKGMEFGDWTKGAGFFKNLGNIFGG